MITGILITDRNIAAKKEPPGDGNWRGYKCISSGTQDPWRMNDIVRTKIGRHVIVEILFEATSIASFQELSWMHYLFFFSCLIYFLLFSHNNGSNCSNLYRYLFQNFRKADIVIILNKRLIYNCFHIKRIKTWRAMAP